MGWGMLALKDGGKINVFMYSREKENEAENLGIRADAPCTTSLVRGGRIHSPVDHLPGGGGKDPQPRGPPPW